ncbi:MAG: methylenetetrahydrofolate reductase [Pseudomonadota bacterium]
MQQPSVSFEFFPPATPEVAYRLWGSAQKLAPVGPSFVSVTYGAGGTTRRRTLDAIAALRRHARLDVAGHLTCVGSSREEVLAVARSYKDMGVCRIVALRGDMPVEKWGDPRPFEPHPDGFTGALDLIETLAREIELPIAVAAYPEPHPDAQSPGACVEHLKRKFDAGADMAITQFFFDNDDYFRLLDKAEAAGIDSPILPGVLPIENISRLKRFAARCGAGLPVDLVALFEKAGAREDAAQASKLLATAVCAEQCSALVEKGVENLHFYTLNDPEIPYSVCRALGIETAPVALAEAG